MTSAQTEPLWQPDEERIATAAVTRFQSWAAEHHGAPAEGGYPALHRWSVEELEAFWRAVVEWFDIRFSTPYERVLGDRSMPGADWFPGAALNYAEHALRAADERPHDTALLHVDETHEPTPVTWAELRRQVAISTASAVSVSSVPSAAVTTT
ncbi:acetyl-coenzyme A synthetase N-terminal domain-containing protein, partial [Streptomyces sp. NPDC006324]|uniref:acetyl-coenzyme A synthetase N-terminal domain-containing protein n=1 Tax=Streptomyces sp. NPDC006324 TaxID=3156751 RepID=UPI0033A98239